MTRLNTFVHVTDVDEDGNQRQGTFGPADNVPDWAIKAITNPKVWDGEPPSIESPVLGGELVEPPRTGKGSGAEAWRKYASDLGWFESIPDDTSRDDIVKAIDDERERRVAETNKE